MKRIAFILLLIGVVAMTGCESLLKMMAKPGASIDGVSLDGISLEKLNLVFDVNVTNPYSFDIPLTNLDYTLASDGAQFLDGKADLAGTSIPAHGSQTVPVPVSVTFANLLKLVQKVKPGEVVPYESALKLWVDVPGTGPIGLPLRYSGSLPVPAAPEIELSEVQWQKLSFDNAGAVLRVRVKNLNKFPVDLTKLTYGLKLAETQVAQSGFDKVVKFAEGQENVLEIPIGINPKNFGLAFFNMLSGGGSNYELGGTMAFDTKFGKIEVPFTNSGQTLFKRD